MLSTLDWAYRAKNITNRPEINQKICKRALLKEYTEEIERSKRDLMATRERNGVYVSFNDYDAMQTLRKEVEEKKNYCKVLEDVIQNNEKIFNDLRSQCDAQVSELTKNTSELNDIRNGYLRMTKESLRQVECVKNEQKRRVEKYVDTERILHTQMKTILNVVNEVSEDAKKLHDKLDRKIKVEKENKKLGLQMRSDFTKRCGNIEDVLVVQKKEIHALLQSVKDEVETHLTAQARIIEVSIRSIVNSAVYQHYVASQESKKDINISPNLAITVFKEKKLLKDINSKLVPYVRDLLELSHNRVLQNVQFKMEDLSRGFNNKISEASRMMDDKFMNQRMGLNNIHNNISEELGASQQQIDKFLTEDFCRDVCTGTTPERKIFSYPRELTTMSPSERISQRFQEDL